MILLVLVLMNTKALVAKVRATELESELQAITLSLKRNQYESHTLDELETRAQALPLSGTISKYVENYIKVFMKRKFL